MDDKALYTAISPPEPLRSNPAFDFLRQDLKLASSQAGAAAQDGRL
jgi:hypothetical protein